MVVFFKKSSFYPKNAIFLRKTSVFSTINLFSRFLLIFIGFIMTKHKHAVKNSLKSRLQFEISLFFVQTELPDELHINKLIFAFTLIV